MNYINTLSLAKKLQGYIVYDNLSFRILKKFYQYGYIESCNIMTDFKNKLILHIQLKNIYNTTSKTYMPLIKKIEMISKPSLSIFWQYRNINNTFLLNRKPNESSMIYLISTSKYGIISHFDCIKKKVGGKVLVKIH